MNTPICDFVKKYAAEDPVRLHMPGHKGHGEAERFDITEIDGADSLYEAAGIIRGSEQNVGELFGCPTFYSTEGSSQCIRAMLYLAVLYAKKTGRKPHIAAGRNAHKTFLSAAALLDVEVTWIYGKDPSYLSCKPDAEQIAELFSSGENPAAVYLTSPDYLGNFADVRGIAEICHKHNALLIVDNAHGAYLRFLEQSQHPIDLGADLCCDSAHKTLPVLTGGAYLHVAKASLMPFAKNALALFGSTSPSYLILQSLDAANAYLAQGYSKKLAKLTTELKTLKKKLAAYGYALTGDEPLKITLCPKIFGYEGGELAEILKQEKIICEFADPDHLVLMFTPEISESARIQLEHVLCSIPRKPTIFTKPPHFSVPERVMGIRKAMFSPGKTIPIEKSAGRVLSVASVGCPPAVPIVMSGERIDESAIACFAYYGIRTCCVVES